MGIQRLSKILFLSSPDKLHFWCPGCNKSHGIRIAPNENSWGWNQDKDKPTFVPSILVTFAGGIPTSRCHSYIIDGKIQFLNDCTHSLAGQTVDLPELPERIKYYE